MVIVFVAGAFHRPALLTANRTARNWRGACKLHRQNELQRRGPVRHRSANGPRAGPQADTDCTNCHESAFGQKETEGTEPMVTPTRAILHARASGIAQS